MRHLDAEANWLAARPVPISPPDICEEKASGATGTICTTGRVVAENRVGIGAGGKRTDISARGEEHGGRGEDRSQDR